MFSCLLRTLLLACLLQTGVHAGPITLKCDLFAGGESFTLQVQPSTDIYNATPLDLTRFRFKALAFGNNEQLQYVKLQAYYRNGPEAILLHQVKLFPPFTHNVPLGGTHYVYSPDLGHELVYQCGLAADTP